MLAGFVFKTQIFNFLLGFMDEKYQETYSELSNTGAYSMVILFVLFSVFSFVILDEEKANKDVVGLRNILLLATVIQFFALINTVAMRMNYYFVIFIPLFLPMLVKNTKVKYARIVEIAHIVMCIFFIGYYFVDAYTGYDMLQLYPYIPYWK
jgi:hypothetical protein